MMSITNLWMSLGDAKPFQDNIQTATSAPQDVTGWTFAFVIHAYGDPSTVYLMLTSASGRIAVPTPTNGQLFWTVFSATDLPGVPAGQYAWYMQRTDTPNQIGLSAGLFTIDPL
jgi:hypothetical protein